MKSKNKPQKALVCYTDLNGVVTDIKYNDFDQIINLKKNETFGSFFERESMPQYLDFLRELRSNKIVLDYPLPVKINGQFQTMHTTGMHQEDQILLIGSLIQENAMLFVNELQQINNEQANEIRRLIKASYDEKSSIEEETNVMLEEMSRLNNELVNIQRELSKRNAELQRLNHLKNQFLGIAAHDIRNPLGVIMAYSEFLYDETENVLTEEYRGFINSIQKSAAFLLHLIEDLLDISKIESGRIELLKSSADMIDLVTSIIKKNNLLASKKQISIQLNSCCDSLYFNYDANKMEQVISNLLTNAVKFSHSGSVVQVSISMQDEKMVRLDVKDTGIGIKAENLESIFMPFNEATNKGTSGEKSTGLGLFIVRSIVNAHGGHIEVQSKLGEGSTFSVFLPLN